jgi:hypothetical protein
MWSSINRGDLERAQEEVNRRRLETEVRQAEEVKSLETRHAEELNELDAKSTQLGDIERAIDAFVHEYLQPISPDETAGWVEGTAAPSVEETAPPAAPPSGELVQHLTAPVEVEVIATNWGKAKFTPAEPSISGRPGRDWGG